MYHTGNRGTSTIVDIGHSTSDRTRHRDTAHEGNYDIGDPLGDQLGIGAMSLPDHAISHTGREEGFNSSQEGDREGG